MIEQTDIIFWMAISALALIAYCVVDAGDL